MDVSQMSACAISNATVIAALTDEGRRRLVELPCGHAPVPLGDLIGDYSCDECGGETYWYSLCLDSAVQDSCTWHCEVCKTCRDWREWHCPTCNRCTYGVSLPCERCEGHSELYDSDW
jgi:hypothetical protein